ncbi:MAG: hypothetical protein K5917_04175 [Clostridiales bacterium]|nr:hypothetical protein [Clostridiales bacterium]
MVLTKDEIKIVLICCGSALIVLLAVIGIIIGIHTSAKETIGESISEEITTLEESSEEQTSIEETVPENEEIVTQPAKVATAQEKKEDSGRKKVQKAAAVVVEQTTQPQTQVEQKEEPEKITIGASTYEQGWNQINGSKYYVANDTLLSGMQNIGGLKYHFDNEGKLTSYTCIDVSEWNDTIDWVKVKQSGIDFAFIRTAWRGYGKGALCIDSEAEKNITNAINAGIHCGLYVFSQAVNKSEAEQEANYLVEIAKKYRIELPLVIDVEWSGDSPNGRADKISVETRTMVVKAFCEKVKSLGYYPMIYTSTYYMQKYLNQSEINCDVWIAEWNTSAPKYSGYSAWQYTDKGSISGIKTGVDLDICLVNYPEYLKNKGYNNL